ncbi:ISNCY family transposase [Sabulicella glaciei]|uniref:ISNCY family transposase n=1 Tax=Sabulicella glaciei TaxID=2984948 RepID=A0ABT3NZR3_9PROT|nr:ISNCY family transposase [Roseococcus sp. MDT2-1-1]MCW8087655.1 ISNCY family transposase [Roseococcus sp. MDT2-1-1]
MRVRYDNCRNLVTLSGMVRLRLRIRRCEAPDCPRFHLPYRPEAEGALALPQHEFGLDVIALVGLLRHRDHRSVPEIHAALRGRGVEIAERSVTNLLDRYDELLASALTGGRHLRRVLKAQGGVILALDGLQPDVGHEVLWVLRDCLSGAVLLARSLLSSRSEDLVPLLEEAKAAVGVPVLGVIGDGQTSIRRAVAEALPGVPHQLCHFHFLREAAHPVFEADRTAKKELKKRVRGVRRIERSVEGAEEPAAEVARGYCAAVRSAITDDGRPPLAASGLKLKARLAAVADSLDRVAEKGGFTPALTRLRVLIGRGLEGTAALWPDIERTYGWVHRAAQILGNAAGETADLVRRRFDGLIGAMTRHGAEAGNLVGAVEHFLKVTRSYRPGLFHCPAVAGLPRTNNDLEQMFGSQRYHERRATGRKTASPALVLRGEVRVLAATATRLHPPSARDLGRVSLQRWRDLRQRLEPRRLARTLRTRFRRDPARYLAALEQQACQQALPT